MERQFELTREFEQLTNANQPTDREMISAIGTPRFLGCGEDKLLLSRCGFGSGKYAGIKSCVRLNTK